MSTVEQENASSTNLENSGSRPSQHRNAIRGGGYYYHDRRNQGQFYRNRTDEAGQPNQYDDGRHNEDGGQSNRRRNQGFRNRDDGEQTNKENRSQANQRDNEGAPHRRNQGPYYRNRGEHGDQRYRRGKENLSSKHVEDRTEHGGVKMEGKMIECLICCQRSDLFGIGSCLHPVCLECCIRMRILGESKSCPTCRADIEMLYFVTVPTDEKWKLPFQSLTHRDSAKHGIRFESDYPIRCYESYLAFACNICAKEGKNVEFPTFESLKHHCGQVHQKSFCHICCENLNILPRNRQTYTKEDLKRHMDGELNEMGVATSRKGHPVCSFCGQRFLDDEHLWRHKRKEHYYCELCHADGLVNEFFKHLDQLHRHYAKNHIVCQEPNCKDLVFRSDLDLDVHKAQEHGNKRLTNLEFNYTRGPRQNRSTVDGGDVRSSLNRVTLISSDTPPLPTTERNVSVIVPSAQGRTRTIIRPSQTAFNPQADFPSLEPASVAAYGQPPNWRSEMQQLRKSAAQPVQPLQVNSGEQFPSLAGQSSSKTSALSSSKPSSSKGSVWAKGNSTKLFTEPPPPVPKAPGRKKFVPSPDVWPEGMREIIEARLKGLPDPDMPKIEDPTLAAAADEAEPKKKSKKKKTKMIPASSVAAPSGIEFPSSSKFDSLSEWNEIADPSKIPKPPKSDKIYKKTGDNFVQIANERPLTLRSVASTIANLDGKKDELQLNEESAKEVPSSWEADADDSTNEEKEKNTETQTSNSVFSPISSLMANVFSLPSRLFSNGITGEDQSNESNNQENLPNEKDILNLQRSDSDPRVQADESSIPSPPGFNGTNLGGPQASLITPPPGFENSTNLPPGFSVK